ncbi:sigma 54-interacting transcriptional regulator [Polyangium sp. rjm3]|uniref:Sigma 54-interacting transcriptional regulator n=2 Tax=Polyangium mundeleinium TaxID=2995306 RepID=A0ABT5EPV9_9BACT|nr:sigma 54-interacting transcriptional regulator [Polyangium mundeleinium]
MVGESPILWDLRHRIAAVARHHAHVLILGESGSGKELVAGAIHARSARGRRPLVSRNAATIPEGLADAELFGNQRNYPNAGVPERHGLVGEAHQSTLAPRVSPVLMSAFVQRRYTTHVRELDALLLRAVLEGRGRYVELPPELKGDVGQAVTSSPRGAPDALTQEERARLALLRKHRFSPTACGRDPAYQGNRQRADLHLRQLICRALRIAAWDIDRAAALLAGSEDSRSAPRRGLAGSGGLASSRQRSAPGSRRSCRTCARRIEVERDLEIGPDMVTGRREVGRGAGGHVQVEMLDPELLR